MNNYQPKKRIFILGFNEWRLYTREYWSRSTGDVNEDSSLDSYSTCTEKEFYCRKSTVEPVAEYTSPQYLQWRK